MTIIHPALAKVNADIDQVLLLLEDAVDRDRTLATNDYFQKLLADTTDLYRAGLLRPENYRER